jgi:hypothetical protein
VVLRKKKESGSETNHIWSGSKIPERPEMLQILRIRNTAFLTDFQLLMFYNSQNMVFGLTMYDPTFQWIVYTEFLTWFCSKSVLTPLSCYTPPPLVSCPHHSHALSAVGIKRSVWLAIKSLMYLPKFCQVWAEVSTLNLKLAAPSLCRV